MTAGNLTPDTVDPDTLELWSFLPPFVQASDAANGYPFLSWLQGGGSLIQATDDLARDMDGYPGWSVIMDVTRCPTDALAWLAQFVGVRFSSTNLTDSQMRAQIVAEQGFQRGTVAAIRAAATPYCDPAALTIDERAGDAYHVVITVPASALGQLYYYQLSLQYSTYSDLDAAFATYADFPDNAVNLLAALQAALPAGLILGFVVEPPLTYADFDPQFSDYAQIAAEFDTYANIP